MILDIISILLNLAIIVLILKDIRKWNGVNFMNEEVREVLNLVRLLDFEEIKKFYYMLKGASVIAANETKSA